MSKQSDTTNKAQLQASGQVYSRPRVASVVLVGGLIALFIALALSVALGAVHIKLAMVWQAIFNFDPEVTKHQIIQELRIPRAIAGALVGAALAVAGAIMQGMTRNAMADSGLLGLNAGAGFTLALAFAFLPGSSYLALMLYSLIGAAIGAILVFGLSALRKGGVSSFRLVLAGAAVTALLVALSEGVALYYHIGQDLAFWYAGGVAGVKWLQIKIVAPWVIGALTASMFISRSITLLSLGEDVAVGLGIRTRWIKSLCIIIVLILAGAAVSIVGSIGFVGLVIPHVARYLVGVDYRLIIPCSAVLGALLIVVADICARMINPPIETPVGALIAIIGVPFFLYLARKEGRQL
jgi:iron complex transport system permease protein